MRSSPSAASDPAIASLWRHADLMRLWTARGVSSLGSVMSYLVFPLPGYSVTGSTLSAGLVGTSYATTAKMSRLPDGVLVDRVDRGRTMIAAHAIAGGLFAVASWALWAHALELPLLLLVAATEGVASAHRASRDGGDADDRPYFATS